jgi:TfoX/Sxy family transcriptional regulator of competence genes
MAMEPPGGEILAVFERHVPDRPNVECKMMFGARGAWVNGNMFMGTFAQDLVLRLSDDARAELQSVGGEPFAPMGRTMREYLVVPRAMHADDALLAAWVERAFEFVAAMPPKLKKPKAPPKERR